MLPKLCLSLRWGSKGYVGAAQVSGPQESVDRCKAALSLEGDMLNHLSEFKR